LRIEENEMRARYLHAAVGASVYLLVVVGYLAALASVA
jgi:hypothetical protein